MNDYERQTPSIEQLLEENRALRLELERLRAQHNSVWPMLTETGRRLQVSSAAIKASVSSLLNYDIFWDGANQHEFLETINSSVDQMGRIITLIVLAFRLEAGTLTLKLEPQILQEIIFVVQAEGQSRFPNLAVRATLPKEGRLVKVDYQYLTLTLVFLLEALEQVGVRSLHLNALENGTHWRLVWEGLNPAASELLRRVKVDQIHSSEVTPVSGEYLLRLHLVCHLLELQGIEIEIPTQSNEESLLHLLIPAI